MNAMIVVLRQMVSVKTLLRSAGILFLPFVLMACSTGEKTFLPTVADYTYDPIVEIKHLRIGVVPGPYGDMILDAIQPLADQGYTAALVQYDDYASPNYALSRNEIDINIFQHYVYLNTFKFENDLALSAIMEIPTVSMGVFSNHYRSVEGFTTGLTVSIPDDVSNLSRALMVLEAAGVITLDPFIDKSKAKVGDITANPYDIRIVLTQAHNLVDSLGLYDVAVINGNFAVSGGLDMMDALYREILADNYINVIAVRTDDLNKQFVRDVIEAIYSERFRNVITDPAGKYAGFQWPRWLHDAAYGVSEGS